MHFDTDAQRPLHAWVLGTNTYAADDVAVQWARSVPPDFHARFSATARRYRYVIFNRRSPPALARGQVTWVREALDADRMDEASAVLLGEHDFSGYRASGCQAKSPVRTVTDCTVTRRGDYVVLDIEANGFLQHMVRNIVGVLLAIGTDQRDPSWAGQVLAGRCRARGGVTAPPDGLYLIGVRYPAQYDLPPICLPEGLW